jgi:hypothetical protein
MSEVDAILAFLAVAAAINFAIIAHLWRHGRARTGAPRDLLFPAGARIAEISGENRDGADVRIAAGDTAYVLVFLSKGCPKCRAVAGEVASAAGRSADRGVELWIVATDGLTAADVGMDPALDAHVLELRGSAYAMLNPRRASPAYLFVASDLVVQAGGFVGDEDWRAFAAQLAEPR